MADVKRPPVDARGPNAGGAIDRGSVSRPGSSAKEGLDPLRAASAGWFAMPDTVHDADLDPYAFRVLAFLYRWADPEGRSFWSYDRIAEECRMSRSRTAQALATLKAAGWITSVKRKGPHGWTSSLFTLTRPVRFGERVSAGDSPMVSEDAEEGERVSAGDSPTPGTPEKAGESLCRRLPRVSAGAKKVENLLEGRKREDLPTGEKVLGRTPSSPVDKIPTSPGAVTVKPSSPIGSKVTAQTDLPPASAGPTQAERFALLPQIVAHEKRLQELGPPTPSEERGQGKELDALTEPEKGRFGADLLARLERDQANRGYRGGPDPNGERRRFELAREVLAEIHRAREKARATVTVSKPGVTQRRAKARPAGGPSRDRGTTFPCSPPVGAGASEALDPDQESAKNRAAWTRTVEQEAASRSRARSTAQTDAEKRRHADLCGALLEAEAEDRKRGHGETPATAALRETFEAEVRALDEGRGRLLTSPSPKEGAPCPPADDAAAGHRGTRDRALTAAGVSATVQR